MSEQILSLPNIKLTKEVLLKLHAQARSLLDEKLGEVMEEVERSELSNDKKSAYLHLVVSQNIGQAIDLYILCYGAELAQTHITNIVEARLEAAMKREAGISNDFLIN